MISPNLLRHRRSRGFSLTEVALAIATVSVSLVSLLGLVSVTLQTGKSSASETSMTTSSHQALDILRTRDFTELKSWYVEPETDETTASKLPTVYIAEDGQWLGPDRSKWPSKEDADAEQPRDAVYKCEVTLEPEASTLTPKVLSSKTTRVNLLRVKLSLSPIIAPADTKPAVQIHATLPRQ